MSSTGLSVAGLSRSSTASARTKKKTEEKL